jgi:glycosyltransferase involved in cell wall biosynthesis
VEFYAQDIAILEDLGFDVRIVTSPSRLCRADFYFIWWWTWALPPLLAARTFRRRALITGAFDWSDFSRRPAPHRRAIELALACADTNVFVSQLEHGLIPRLLRVRRPRFSPLVVPTEVYRPGSDAREDFVLTVSWLQQLNAQRKCIPQVLRAASLVHASHPSVRFVVAGEHGTAISQLKEQVTELNAGDYVRFPGAIGRTEKVRLMQSCRVYLQPSTFEGFGLAILEAMSCGACVVTSPVGAVPEVVGDAALMVDGTSPTSIADCVRTVLDRPGLQRALGQRARQRAERLFAYERRRQDLKAIIDELL